MKFSPKVLKFLLFSFWFSMAFLYNFIHDTTQQSTRSRKFVLTSRRSLNSVGKITSYLRLSLDAWRFEFLLKAMICSKQVYFQFSLKNLAKEQKVQIFRWKLCYRHNCFLTRFFGISVVKIFKLCQIICVQVTLKITTAPKSCSSESKTNFHVSWLSLFTVFWPMLIRTLY